MSTPSPWIIETTTETFEHDVIERSRERPVVVDFWAEWCGPCRMLGPVLERLADEYNGAFVLVKANTEALGEIAASFGVRSIPAVFGISGATIKDSFVGVLSEPALRAFVDGLMPTPAEKAAAEAWGLETTDPAGAESRYREALALSADLDDAAIGLARVLAAQGQLDQAGQTINDLERRRGFLAPEAEKIRAAVTLQSQGRDTGTVDQARAAAAASPNDLNLRFALAEALAAAGGYEEALEILLDLVERNRDGLREPARKTMLAIFRLLEGQDIVGDYQRKLAAALF